MAIQFARARYICPRLRRQRGALGGVQRPRRRSQAERDRRGVPLPPPRRAGAPRGAVARRRAAQFAEARRAVERGRGGGEAQRRPGRPRDRAGAAGRPRAVDRGPDRTGRDRSPSAHFVAKGLAVQLDVHAPHKERGEGEGFEARANWHAHLLITTRRVEGEMFTAKKARDLDPDVRQAGGRARVADGEAVGRVVARAPGPVFPRTRDRRAGRSPRPRMPGEHIGPVRMRKADRRRDRRTRRDAAPGQPGGGARPGAGAGGADAQQRHVHRARPRPVSRQAAGRRADGRRAAPRRSRPCKTAVLATATTWCRCMTARPARRRGGSPRGRCASRSVRRWRRRGGAVPAPAPARCPRPCARRRRWHGGTLRQDQRRRSTHAIAAGELKLIEGRAGTGKSYTLAAIRDAHEAARQACGGIGPDQRRGAGPEGGRVSPKRAQSMRRCSDQERADALGPAAPCWWWTRRRCWTRRVTGELLAEARRAGAKLILAGDDRQLASIERGGLFTELRQRHGAAEITEVTRQRVDWQRQAARDLAEGRFDEAVAAFDRAGAITWTADQEEARGRAGGGAGQRDTAAEPRASRFVFAYTNARRGRAECRAAPGAARSRRAGRPGCAVRDEARARRTSRSATGCSSPTPTSGCTSTTAMPARSPASTRATGQITARLDAAAGHGPGGDVVGG